MPSSQKLSDGCWSGVPCYVVGGGPSLKGFDWSLLAHKRRIVAINRAIKDVPWADVWFTEDLRVVQLFSKDTKWNDFSGVKVFHALDPSFVGPALECDPELFVIKCERKGKYWSQSLAEGLSYSSNSGVGAINLACILGMEPIYLLGFDCRSTNGIEQNYHNDYERAGFDRTGQHQYHSFKSDFEHWVAPHVPNKVVNLINPQFPSAISCWPKWDRDQYLGDPEVA